MVKQWQWPCVRFQLQLAALGFKIMVIGHKTALHWHTKSCIALLLHVNACASWCMVSKCVELVILPSRRLSSQLQGCLSSVLVLAGALTIMNCLVCKQFRNKEYWKDSPRTSSRAFRNIGNIIFQGTPRNCATKNTKPKDFHQTTFTEVCKRQHHKHKENTQSESRNAKTP